MKTVILSISVIFMAFIYVNAQNPNNELDLANPNASEITFDSDNHDFGNIKKMINASYEFKFKNTGKSPLILSGVNPSCGCTTPTWPKEPILPGKSASIKVVYDSKSLGIFNKSITVISNAKNSPVVLYIKGNVFESKTKTSKNKKINKK